MLWVGPSVADVVQEMTDDERAVLGSGTPAEAEEVFQAAHERADKVLMDRLQESLLRAMRAREAMPHKVTTHIDDEGRVALRCSRCDVRVGSCPAVKAWQARVDGSPT